MHGVHEQVIKWSSDNKVDMTTRMKAGDENVYELKDPNSFVTGIESLKKTLHNEIDKLHVRVFRVDQMPVIILMLQLLYYYLYY